jgi:hypothetical protein
LDKTRKDKTVNPYKQVYRPPANNTVGVYLVEDEREEEDEDEEEVEVGLSKAVDQGQGLCGQIAPDPVDQTVSCFYLNY